MAAVTQLEIYNGALAFVRERPLLSLTEKREPRFAIDAIYAKAIQHALEMAYWKFAIRSATLSPSSPAFGSSFDDSFQTADLLGYDNQYSIPADCVQPYQLSGSAQFDPLLTDYREERGYWLTQCNPLYILIVSNDVQYGMNMAVWPPTFQEYLSCYLAWKIAPGVAQARDIIDILDKTQKKLLSVAMAKSAMRGPARKAPYGSWARSRRGSYSGTPPSGTW